MLFRATVKALALSVRVESGRFVFLVFILFSVSCGGFLPLYIESDTLGASCQVVAQVFSIENVFEDSVSSRHAEETNIRYVGVSCCVIPQILLGDCARSALAQCGGNVNPQNLD
jgi:hypothetical protein